MPTASNPHCRHVFRTPTFLKSLAELKIGAKEADDIVHFVATNAKSGTIDHRQLGFVLKRLPWEKQLWVQFLEDSSRNIYLLAMTDEDAGPRPPKKAQRLTRILDRLWVAAAVKGAEWLGNVIRGLRDVPHRSSADQVNAISQFWPDLSNNIWQVRVESSELLAGPVRIDAANLIQAYAHLDFIENSTENSQFNLSECIGAHNSSSLSSDRHMFSTDGEFGPITMLTKSPSEDDASIELKTMWIQLASRISGTNR